MAGCASDSSRSRPIARTRARRAQERAEMCLAVPGRVLETFVDGEIRMGKVAFGGVARRVCLEYTPEAQAGDYVLVHVGFALSRIDEAQAQRTFAMLRELGALEPEGMP